MRYQGVPQVAFRCRVILDQGYGHATMQGGRQMTTHDALPRNARTGRSAEQLAGAAAEFSPFPPIADYGFLSDCEVTALVAPSGAVEWLCLPRMDGPSVFGAILDRDAEHTLLRTVRCVNGEVQVVLDCEPVFDYGRERVRWQYTDKGFYQTVARSEATGLNLTLSSDMRMGLEGPR